MNPLEAASALATIVQLLGMFVQERKGQKELRKEDFFEWLETHRHEELKELICNTYHLSEQVDGVLRTNHTEIIREFQAVNGALAQVMSRLQALGPLAERLTPEISLSDFALEALREFEGSGESDMISFPEGGGVQFGNTAGPKSDDPRFLPDDMDTLETCGLIKAVSHDVSYSVYRLTRRGAAYARMLAQQPNMTVSEE